VPEHCRQLGCRKLIHCSQLSETPGHAQKLPDTHLRQEAIIAIQAGTNGISTAIAFAFFFLVSNPEIYAKLKAEIKAYFPDFDGSETFDGKMVEKLPYLNAVAEESLRLGAPLGSFPRVTPKGGAYIAGQYIPEDTIVGVPAWAQMISEENFYPLPESFIPERWLSSGLGPDSRCNKNAIMTFSHGAPSPFGIQPAR
jgi:cytochrome P450